MLECKPVSDGDEAFLFELYCSTRREEMLSWNWDPRFQRDFLRMQWTSQRLSYSMQYPNADHRVIRVRNQHAGRIMVDRGTLIWTLVDISILPGFQRQGLGTRLIHELQTEALGHGMNLRLSVMKNNPAQRWYEIMGFTLTGDNELYDLMEWCAAG